MKLFLTNSAIRPYAIFAAPIPANDEIRLEALREHLDFKDNTLETMPGLLAGTFKHGKYEFFATTLQPLPKTAGPVPTAQWVRSACRYF